MLSIKSGNLLNILTGANKMQLPGSLLRVTVASSNIINETLFCFVLLKNASLEWYSLLIHIFIPKLHPERGFALHKAARGQVSFQKPEPTGSRRALGVFTGARPGRDRMHRNWAVFRCAGVNTIHCAGALLALCSSVGRQECRVKRLT